MKNLFFEVSSQKDSLKANELVKNLVAYNNSQADTKGHQALFISITDSNSQLIGGLQGHSQWNWLFISHLWVLESHRKQQLGTQLIQMAEEEALKRGCSNAHLDTYSFQALDFYLKLGYKEFGKLEDFPAGHCRYFLSKTLQASDDF